MLKYKAKEAICSLSSLPAIIRITGFSISLFLYASITVTKTSLSYPLIDGIPLLEFALGVEAAQVIIVLLILLTGSLVQSILGVNRRDWILVASSIVIGIAIQMMIDRVFW